MYIIEICQTNKANWTKSLRERMERDFESSGVEMLEYDCLGNCEQCSASPFVIVEGEFVTADCSEALLEEIKSYLKKKEELDRQWRELGF